MPARITATVQVRLHVLAVVVGLVQLVQLDDILVGHLQQEDHLAIRALRVRRILERVKDLLERHDSFRLALFAALLDGPLNDAVRALAKLLGDIVVGQHVLIDVLHAGGLWRADGLAAAVAAPNSTTSAQTVVT